MGLTPLENVSFAKWRELVRTRFRVHASPAETVELVLLEVTQGPPLGRGSGGGGQYESFSLLFQGPGTRLLSQTTYRFAHEQVGEFDLFIVPIAKAQEGYHYEAVFNRLMLPAV